MSGQLSPVRKINHPYFITGYPKQNFRALGATEAERPGGGKFTPPPPPRISWANSPPRIGLIYKR
jgi:hypothetical protein